MRPLALALLIAATQARGAVVVVLPLADDPSVAAELRSALATVPGLTVQSAGATAESLAAAQALGLSFAVSVPSCMVELGGLANGDLVVGGSLTPVPEGASITLRLMEVASKKERRSATLVIPTGEGRARALHLVAIRVADPDRERGSLTVRVRPAGASVVVDEKRHGLTPLAGPISLTPGTHEVYIARPGFVSASAFVDVRFDEEAVLDVELVRDETASFGTEPIVAPREHVDEGPPPSRVAITSVDVTGGEPTVGRDVAGALASEIAKLDGVSVVRLADVPDLLEEKTAVMLACREAGCNQLVASGLAVDTLVQVDIEVTGDESSIAVRRVDGASGELLMEDSRGMQRRDGGELVDAVGAMVQRLFADRHLRAGELRGASIPIVEDTVARRGQLPRWVFFSSMAATGAAAGTTAGLFAFSQFEANPGKKSGLELSMWIAVGTTAALTVADVAIAVVTDW